MNRRMLLAAVLALAVGLPMTAKDNPKSGFAGKWMLDKKQSPNGADAPDDLLQNIKQKGNQVVINSTWKEPKNGVYGLSTIGLTTSELKLNTDGTEDDYMIGPYHFKSKTTMDGNKMVTTWAAASDNADNKAQLDGTWTRTLSDDGRQMTVQIQGKANDGRSTDSTLIFKRK